MYLKRLELLGFKSFARKVEIEFGPGITAIVGPNGSGKSNLADAVRWVLGEPSARPLRGTRMEDLIFSGSSSRKPLNVAEVSVTLDNTDGTLPLDFTEVTITRRVYRDGQSEFLVNRVPCRLKDLQDLLMDTGLGREAYSLVGQGRLEEVLSGKPGDRRGLLEEAAGIVRYQSRKEEAARRLQETQGRLVRLGDIIKEVEARLGPLEEEAARAGLYREYRRELEGLEAGLYLKELASLRARYREREELNGRLRSSREDRQARLQGLEEEQERLRHELSSLEEGLGRQGQELNLVLREMQACQGQIDVLEERIKANRGAREKIEGELPALRQKLAAVEAEAVACSLEEENARREREEGARALAAAREALAMATAELASAREAVDTGTADLLELLNRMAGVRNRLAALDAAWEGGKANARRREEERWRLEEALRELRAAREARERELVAGREKVASSSDRLLRMEREKSEAMARRADRDREARELYRRAEALRGKLHLLAELDRELAGYQGGVKAVLAGLRRGEALFRGVAGAVAELLEVPEEYERAIEVALGPALHYLVTTSEEQARDIIGYLKQTRAGRASFLPLEVIRAPRLTPYERRAAGAPAALGTAASLVRCQPRYRAVIEHLLGRVVVAPTLREAALIAREADYRVKVVTLDGEVIHRGGMLTGGHSSSREDSSPLGRRREREETARALHEVEKGLASLQVELESLGQQVAGLDVALEKEGQSLQEHKMRLATLEMEQARLEKEIGRLEQGLASLLAEEEALELEMAGNREEAGRLAGELRAMAEEEASLRASIDRGVQRVEGGDLRREELAREVTEATVRLARQEQQLLRLQGEAARLRQQQEELARLVASRETELDELRKEGQSLTRQVDEHTRRWEQWQRQAAELEGRILEGQKKRQSLSRSLQARDRQVIQLRRELEGFLVELHAGEIEATRLQEQARSLQEKLATEYPTASLAAPPEPPDPEQARARVVELKGLIEALGPVNPGAVEEYSRVKERYDFLQDQGLDLRRASEDLERVIAEMEARIELRFQETFLAVRHGFREVFRSLFGGGEADLLLVEDGVDIVAQPPGKKLQHLSLLSGGEKALTAIALLFALLRVRPAPFYVLDEIDAALDEANLGRYAGFLRGMASRSQFILVTHQRATMEVADALYGVTMEESGVSTLFSVRLEDKERTA